MNLRDFFISQLNTFEVDGKPCEQAKVFADMIEIEAMAAAMSGNDIAVRAGDLLPGRFFTLDFVRRECTNLILEQQQCGLVLTAAGQGPRYDIVAGIRSFDFENNRAVTADGFTHHNVAMVEHIVETADEITGTSIEFNADVVVSDPLTTAAGKDRPQIHCRKDAIQAAVDWGLVEVDDSDTVLSFKCSQVGLKRIVATFAPEQTPKTKRAWRDWLARNEGWLIEEFAGDGVTEIEWLK